MSSKCLICNFSVISSLVISSALIVVSFLFVYHTCYTYSNEGQSTNQPIYQPTNQPTSQSCARDLSVFNPKFFMLKTALQQRIVSPDLSTNTVSYIVAIQYVNRLKKRQKDRQKDRQTDRQTDSQTKNRWSFLQ